MFYECPARSIWWTGGSLFDPWQRLGLISSEHVARTLKDPPLSKLIEIDDFGCHWQINESTYFNQSAVTDFEEYHFQRSYICITLHGWKGIKINITRSAVMVFKWTLGTNIYLALFTLNRVQWINFSVRKNSESFHVLIVIQHTFIWV